MKKLYKENSDKFTTYLLLTVAFIVSQIMVSTGIASNKFEGLLVPVCVNILLAVSLNLVVGISGELSLGHAGFMCVGAFAGSLFSVITVDSLASAWIRFPLALLLGGIMAGVVGFIIGIPVLRLRGDYLAIVTLAFGEIIKNLIENIYLAVGKDGVLFTMSSQTYASNQIVKDFIKGPQGITGTPSDSELWICYVVLMIALFVMFNIINSKTGRCIMASRDNRIAAEAMGINVTRSKMIAFVVSAFFAGVAGVLYSHNLYTLTASKFDYNQSILILVFVVLGGMRSMKGSVIAATILYALPEMLRGLADFRMLLYAIVLIAMMLLNNNAKFKAMLKKLSEKILSFCKGLAKKGEKA